MKIERFSGEYAFLSNFSASQVMLDGLRYPTVEHAFQAAKTFEPKERDAVRQVDARTAKRLGRRCTLRSDWESSKLGVMRNLLCQKFADPTLRAKLVATGDAILIEGNTWGDRFWGCVHGEGENWLGRLLMEVRDQRARPINSL